MTIFEHLEEFRYRLVISAVAFFIGSIIAYFLFHQILHLLELPIDKGGRIAGVTIKGGLSVQGVTTAFTVRLKIAIFGGFVIALPVILFQIWRFITPGLEPQEKKYAIPFVLGSVGLFLFGAVVAYLVLPEALGFLLRFGRGLNQIIFLDQYIGFVTFMVLAFAITFEIPMLLLFLAAAGVVSSQWLRKHRRHAIVVSVIVAAVATPSQDPYSNGMLAIPLYLMYEAAVLIVRFVMKK